MKLFTIIFLSVLSNFAFAAQSKQGLRKPSMENGMSSVPADYIPLNHSAEEELNNALNESPKFAKFKAMHEMDYPNLECSGGIFINSYVIDAAKNQIHTTMTCEYDDSPHKRLEIDFKLTFQGHKTGPVTFIEMKQ